MAFKKPFKGLEQLLIKRFRSLVKTFRRPLKSFQEAFGMPSESLKQLFFLDARRLGSLSGRCPLFGVEGPLAQVPHSIAPTRQGGAGTGERQAALRPPEKTILLSHVEPAISLIKDASCFRQKPRETTCVAGHSACEKGDKTWNWLTNWATFSDLVLL